MKKIYSSPNIITITHFKNILASHHIESCIKNEFLVGAVGELPANECWPELWIEEIHFEQASEILKSLLASAILSTDPWRCTRCGEEIEGQFTECWQCGENRYR